MDERLRAHSRREVQYYLMVTPCPACGKGPWLAAPAEEGSAEIVAACEGCGHGETFHFVADAIEGPAPDPHVPGIEAVNTTEQPSRIIDVGQWLSLFRLFVEAGARETSKFTGRRLGFEAAQCLSEALKFYGDDDEMPPPEALFTESSRRAFRDHPDKFARQRLREMREKLPSLSQMTDRLAADRLAEARRPWWKFWRRRR